MLAGCGGEHARHRSAPTCPSGPGAGRVVRADLELLTCAYGAVRVTYDTAPQAYVRWDRAQVELFQNTGTAWGHDPARRPRAVYRLGLGAFWVPIERRLETTDGRVLLTVVVPRGAGRARAIKVARAALRG